MWHVLLLDGYIDEPSCLGVPPYISPHVRYIYGALLEAGLKEEKIGYLTADEFRQQEGEMAVPWVIVVGGTTVPGRYLGGEPLTLKEMTQLPAGIKAKDIWLVGPVVEAGLTPSGYSEYHEGAGVDKIFSRLKGHTPFSTELLFRFSLQGAKLISRHPNYPYVMAEIETYRGCKRPSHCSFCSEQFKTLRYSRAVEDVVGEVKALYREGGRYFRLGCQPDLLSYSEADQNVFKELYSGIRDVAPELKVLHLDNINPTSVVRPGGRELLNIITEYNTPGDTASLGLESADPDVIAANNIGTTPEICLEAVEIINEIGGRRMKGIPLLLPGLNFLHGLKGETRKTMDLNFNYLKNILAKGLLLKRINIRQVIAHRDYENAQVSKGAFLDYKKKVNEEINQPMMRKVFPQGTVFREVIPEKFDGRVTFSRQMGTYPIRVGIPGNIPLGAPLDVKVIQHGFRSLTALPYPFNINNASIEQLEALPGVGKKRASNIILQRPLAGPEDIYRIMGDEPARPILELVDFFGCSS